MYPKLDSGLVLDFFLLVFGNRLVSLHLNSLEIVEEKWRVQDDNTHLNY